MSGGRLNCVKGVLKKSIKQIKDDHPNRKVGIVLFESSIHVIGDGSMKTLIINEMDNYDYLLKNGITISKDMVSKQIKDTEKAL